MVEEFASWKTRYSSKSTFSRGLAWEWFPSHSPIISRSCGERISPQLREKIWEWPGDMYKASNGAPSPMQLVHIDYKAGIQTWTKTWNSIRRLYNCCIGRGYMVYKYLPFGTTVNDMHTYNAANLHVFIAWVARSTRLVHYFACRKETQELHL